MDSFKSQKIPKSLLFLLLLLTTFGNVTAQDKNPFKNIGKEGNTLTLSNDKYEELFDQDSIQQIGSALVNIRQMKVIKLLESEKETERLLDNSLASRFLSVDPLAFSFPWNSPYSYAENDVIRSIDLDGKEKLVKTYYQVVGGHATKLTKSDGNAIVSVIENQNWSGQKDVNVFLVFSGKRSGEYVYYDSKDPGEAENKMRQDGITIKSWDRKLPSTVKIVQEGLTSQDPQLVAFRETVKNYFTAVGSILTLGGGASIKITGAAKSALSTKLGKIGFDAFAQSLTKGGLDKIDWSDAAFSGLIENRAFRNLLKSFVDASSEKGIDIKALNDGLLEFGLRLVNDKLMTEKTTGSGRYAVDVAKKVLLSEEKEAAKKVANEKED